MAVERAFILDQVLETESTDLCYAEERLQVPTPPTMKRPNAVTIAAMEELRAGGGTVFYNTADLFASWEEDD